MPQSHNDLDFFFLWELWRGCAVGERGFPRQVSQPCASGKPWGHITSDLQVVHAPWFLLDGAAGRRCGARSHSIPTSFLWAEETRAVLLPGCEFLVTACSMFTQAHSSSHQMRHLFPLSGRCCILLNVVFRGCLWSSLKHHRVFCEALLQFLWGW